MIFLAFFYGFQQDFLAGGIGRYGLLHCAIAASLATAVAADEHNRNDSQHE